MRRIVARVPREAFVVAVAYVVTAAYFLSRALDVHSYIWLVDEMLYTKGALGFAGGHLTGHVFGVPESVHAPLYSWVLAPVYGILNSQHAFKAAHGVDALLFAGVLVPAYLTARHLRATPLMATLAALLAVWVPYSAATLVLMSESLAYFTFAWAVWAMVRALSEPTPKREALALACIAATAYTRPQFTLLFGIYLLAAVVVEAGLSESKDDLRDRLKAHRLLGAAVLLGLLLVAIAGRSLLGGYSQTAGLPRFPPGLWQNMLSHAAHVVVGSGILPAIVWLGWVLRTAMTRLDRRHYAFAVLSALIAAFIFYEVGFYSQNVVGGRIQERTAFYPLLLFALGVAAFSSDLRLRAPRLSLVAAAAGIALLIGAAPFTPDEAPGAFEAIANPGASFNKDLGDALHWLSKAPSEALAIVAILIGIGATVAAAPRFRRIGLPAAAALALLFCVVQTATVLGRDVKGLNTAIPSALGSPTPPRAWVDGALFKSGGDAGALESPVFAVDSATAWQWVEFWNKSVNRLYTLDGAAPYSGLPTLPLHLNQQTGAIRTPLEKKYVVVAAGDSRFGLQGDTVKQGPFGMNLIKPLHPFRAAWAAVGSEPDPLIGGAGQVKGKQLALAIYRPAGATPGSEARVSVKLAVARVQKPALPVDVVVKGTGHPLLRTLTTAHPIAELTFAVTIPADAQRTLITFTARATAGTTPPKIGFGQVRLS